MTVTFDYSKRQAAVDRLQPMITEICEAAEQREFTGPELEDASSLIAKMCAARGDKAPAIRSSADITAWGQSSPIPDIIRNQPLQWPSDPRTFAAARDTRVPHGFQTREQAELSGHWLRALVRGNAESCRVIENVYGPDQLRAMTVGSPIAGGTLVPDEFALAIGDLLAEYGVARRECNVISMTRDSMTVPRFTGSATVAWTGEGGSYTETDRPTDAVNLSAKKLTALLRVSEELLDDSALDIAAMISRHIAWGFAQAEDQALIDGDGSNTYGNIIGLRTKMVDGSHTGSYVDATAGDDQWSEIEASDLATLVGTLPNLAGANAKWYVSPRGWGLTMLRLMMAAGGNCARDMAMGGGDTMFYGKPVVLVNAMPSTLSAQDQAVMFLYGDLRQAVTLGDRQQMRLQVLRERYADSGEVGFKVHERLDINVHDIVERDDSTAPGAVIGLRGNTS